MKFSLFKLLFASVLLSGIAILSAQQAATASRAPDEEQGEKETEASKLPFPPGEKLTYEIRWSVFPVGSATLEIQGPVEFQGEEAYRVLLTAQTNSFADGFFKVRNYNASWIDTDLKRPLHYVKHQNEGRTQRQVVVTFDWENNTAQYSNYGEKREPVKIVPETWDPLSIVYAVRNMDVGNMTQVNVPTTDGKKFMDTEINVKGRERIKVPAGQFDTIVINPDTKDLGGVFKKSRNAGITFWFSDDHRKLPVRMASSVAVGSFVAELVKVEGPGSEAYGNEEGDSGRGQPDRRVGPRR